MTTKFAVLSVAMLLLSGCINITASLHPINESVKAERTSSDCAGIAFGFGFGDLSVERAMITNVNRVRVHDPLGLNSSQPSIEEEVPNITKIRSIELQDFQFLFFGERCIVVTGE